MMTCRDYWWVIVDGYIRQENKAFLLNISEDINGLIYRFYKDEIRYFDKYNKEMFKLENDGKKIVPIRVAVNTEYANYMVFPSPNGFNKGVHKWAVKYIGHMQWGSVRSIGVTTKMDGEWISNGVGEEAWCDDDNGSHNRGNYASGCFSWLKTETIEIILDLDESVISYYKILDNDASKNPEKVKEDKLEPDETYYFALCVDSDSKCGIFECVMPQTTD